MPFISFSELCIFLPFNVYLVSSGCSCSSNTVSGRHIAQHWVLHLCLSPVVTLSIAAWLRDFRLHPSVIWLNCKHLSVHHRSLEEDCVSKPDSKWRFQGDFFPRQQQQLRKNVGLFVFPFSTARYLDIPSFHSSKVTAWSFVIFFFCHFS